jgi:hypothetical protein
MDLLYLLPRELLEILLFYTDEYVNILNSDTMLSKVLEYHTYWNMRIYSIFESFVLDGSIIKFNGNLPNDILCKQKDGFSGCLFKYLERQRLYTAIVNSGFHVEYWFSDIKDINMIFPSSAIDNYDKPLSSEFKKEIEQYILNNYNKKIPSDENPYLVLLFGPTSAVYIHQSPINGKKVLFGYMISPQDTINIMMKLGFGY